MAEKFTTYDQYDTWYKSHAQTSDAKVFFASIRDRLINETDKRSMAKGAFLDIYGEMIANGRTSDAYKIYDILYNDYTETGADLADPGGAIWDKRKIEYNFLPSAIENRGHRKAHIHLIDLIHKSGEFKEYTANRMDIAQRLYKDYRVLDVGGKQNLSFTTRELRENNFTAEDVLENLPYMMVYFEKLGYELTPFPDGYGDTENQQKILGKMIGEMRSTDSGANMWTAYRRTGDGGLEVNIMAGNHDELQFDAVQRWHYIKDGKAEPLIIDNVLMWKILKQAKATNFIDAQQDPWETGVDERRKMLPAVSWGLGLGQDTIKEKWEKWYVDLGKKNNKGEMEYSGPQGGDVWQSIPDPLIEVFDPRKFEWDSIIKPLWEKYGHLSHAEFEEKVEIERQKNTWTFTERHLKNILKKWEKWIFPPGSPTWSSIPHEAKWIGERAYDAFVEDE